MKLFQYKPLLEGYSSQNSSILLEVLATLLTVSLSKFCKNQLLGKILSLTISTDQDKKGVVRPDVISK